MKSGLTPKTISLGFVALLALYLAAFYGMEEFRRHSGPWEVVFEKSVEGSPAIAVSQPSRGLHNFKIVFHGEATTNSGAPVRFDRVKQPVPFGKVIYEDLTFLPGVVTFDFFGHEVELLTVAKLREVLRQELHAA